MRRKWRNVSKVKFAKCIEGQIWDLGYTACPCGASRMMHDASGLKVPGNHFGERPKSLIQ